MKLSAVAVVAAGAAVASASPLRVIVLSSPPPSEMHKLHHNMNMDPSALVASGGGPLVNIRIGHPAANLAQLAPLPPHHHDGETEGARRPCAGMMRGGGRWRWRQKAVEVANKFRSAFGLPLIEEHHPMLHPHHHHGHPNGTGPKTIHGGMIQILPASAGGGRTWVDVKGQHRGEGGAGQWWGFTKGGDRVEFKMEGGPGPGPQPNVELISSQGELRPHDVHREPSFLFRLQMAIVALGPWEGRAVAFVLGAGIGVLLRMLWVLALVAYRGLSGGQKDYYTYGVVGAEDEEEDEEDEHEHGLRGTPVSAPPSYVYPLDEKEVYEEIAQRAEEIAGKK